LGVVVVFQEGGGPADYRAGSYPVLLIKLLWNVIVAGLFGQYADRRLIIAALETVAPDELSKRAQGAKLQPNVEGAVWLDFVADLGDGFDSTYAIASLVGAPTRGVAAFFVMNEFSTGGFTAAVAATNALISQFAPR
jgi:hypothetical protein